MKKSQNCHTSQSSSFSRSNKLNNNYNLSQMNSVEVSIDKDKTQSRIYSLKDLDSYNIDNDEMLIPMNSQYKKFQNILDDSSVNISLCDDQSNIKDTSYIQDKKDEEINNLKKQNQEQTRILQSLDLENQVLRTQVNQKRQYQKLVQTKSQKNILPIKQSNLSKSQSKICSKSKDNILRESLNANIMNDISTIFSHNNKENDPNLLNHQIEEKQRMINTQKITIQKYKVMIKEHQQIILQYQSYLNQLSKQISEFNIKLNQIQFAEQSIDFNKFYFGIIRSLQDFFKKQMQQKIQQQKDSDYSNNTNSAPQQIQQINQKITNIDKQINIQKLQKDWSVTNQVEQQLNELFLIKEESSSISPQLSQNSENKDLGKHQRQNSQNFEYLYPVQNQEEKVEFKQMGIQCEIIPGSNVINDNSISYISDFGAQNSFLKDINVDLQQKLYSSERILKELCGYNKGDSLKYIQDLETKNNKLIEINYQLQMKLVAMNNNNNDKPPQVKQRKMRYNSRM